MSNKKMIATIASTALAACLGLAGCGGNQPAPESAAPTSTTSSATTNDSPTSSVAPNSTATSISSTTSDTSTTAPTSSATSDTGSYIGDQAAIDAALANAGFTVGDVTELEAELDLDDPSGHYDVSFKQGGMEYDYDIDATTGAILTSTSETEN